MTDGNPKVTIIVPIYAVEDYVGECMDSLAAQTFGDFEVVCIDDGSPDDSAEIARKAVAGDPRFRFVHKENGGLSSARNRGLAEARGNYIAFLDSDDTYVPEAIELLYLTAAADDLDYLDFTAHTYYESAHMKRVLNEDWFEQRTDVPGVMPGTQLFTRYQQLDEYCCSACFHFFKRGLAERAQLRFREGIIHEDELFSPLLLAHAERASFLNEPLYLRRMRDASIMNTKRGMRNIVGMTTAARELEAWLCHYVEGDVVDRDFVRALAERIAMLRWIAVNDALSLDETELRAHASELDDEDLVDFELAISGGMYAYNKIRTELDWRRLRRTAHAVLDGPIYALDTLRDLRR